MNGRIIYRFLCLLTSKHMRNKKGFTLIELLIVIAIIGVLSAALLPSILNAPARGRDAARLGNINSIVAALEAYNSDNGHYPTGEGCIGSGDVFDTGLGSYFAGGQPPTDPSGERDVADGVTDPGDCVAAGQYYYNYVGTTNVAEYVLGTVMEIEGNNNSATNPADISDTAPTDGSDYYVLIQ